MFSCLNINEKLLPSPKRELNNPKIYLCLLSQCYTLRLADEASLVESTRATIADLWSQLVTSLVSAVKVDTATDRRLVRKCDLDHSTAALFLYLFHNLNLERQKHVFVQIVRSLSAISPLSTRPPLIFSRLVFLFDYLLRHFDEPSQILLDHVDRYLLNHAQLGDGDEWSNYSQLLYRNLEGTTSRNTAVFYDLAYFSYLMTPSTTALKVLQDEKLVDYDRLYVSLVQAADWAREVVYTDATKEQFASEEFASISYNFDLVWSLLDPCMLPISSKYIQDMLASNLFESQPNVDKCESLSFDFFHMMRILYDHNENDDTCVVVASRDLQERINALRSYVTTSSSNEAQFFVRIWSDREINVSDMLLLNYQLVHLEKVLKR